MHEWFHKAHHDHQLKGHRNKKNQQQKEDVIKMADKQANQIIFSVLGLYILMLLNQCARATEEQQLWAATLKEKAIGMFTFVSRLSIRIL